MITLTDKQKSLFNSMRSKWFDIVSYLTEFEIDCLCKTLAIENYCYICHDKDVNEEGELKKAHYHLVLCFDSVRRATPLVKMFQK